jgi:hypothetical protein
VPIFKSIRHVTCYTRTQPTSTTDMMFSVSVINLCRFNLVLKCKNLQPTLALAEAMKVTQLILSTKGAYMVLVNVIKHTAVPVHATDAWCVCVCVCVCVRARACVTVYSITRHYMEVSGYPRAPADLAPGKEPH